MKHFIGFLIGIAIFSAMTFTVRSLPVEMQGSSGMLIGLIVGMALMVRESRKDSAQTAQQCGGRE